MSNVMASASAQFRRPASRATSFMEAHGLDYKQTDRLLGFASQGYSSRRWETNGVPPHVDTMMAYIDKYGTAVPAEIAAKRDARIKDASADLPKKRWHIQPVKVQEFRVPAMTVFNWRTKQELSQRAFDRLFGFTSLGRSCRLWETKGAPAYAEVFLALLDAHGLDLASELAAEREKP